MDIDVILVKHKAWLDGLVDGEKAYLRDAYLRDADLRDADLRYADLRDADLRDADLRYADLRDADLCGADLRGANFCGADLRGVNFCYADLCGAELDFSAFPLCCGGLNVHIDDRIATQLLYHLVRNVLYSKNTSSQLKELLSKAGILKQANQFHRVNECGKI